MTKNEDTALAPIEQISSSILLMRGYRVILDRDLAAIELTARRDDGIYIVQAFVQLRDLLASNKI